MGSYKMPRCHDTRELLYLNNFINYHHLRVDTHYPNYIYANKNILAAVDLKINLSSLTIDE